MEHIFGPNPDRYARCKVIHADVDAADQAMLNFVRDLQQLRELYGIPEVCIDLGTYFKSGQTELLTTRSALFGLLAQKS
jgi:hypothetical protein